MMHSFDGFVRWDPPTSVQFANTHGKGDSTHDELSLSWSPEKLPSQTAGLDESADVTGKTKIQEQDTPNPRAVHTYTYLVHSLQ